MVIAVDVGGRVEAEPCGGSCTLVTRSAQASSSSTATLHTPSRLRHGHGPRSATLSIFWGRSEGGSLLAAVKVASNTLLYYYCVLFTPLPLHVSYSSLQATLLLYATLTRPRLPRDNTTSTAAPRQTTRKHTISVPSTVADIVTAPAHPSTSHTVFPVIPIIGYTPSRNERIVA